MHDIVRHDRVSKHVWHKGQPLNKVIYLVTISNQRPYPMYYAWSLVVLRGAGDVSNLFLSDFPIVQDFGLRPTLILEAY